MADNSYWTTKLLVIDDLLTVNAGRFLLDQNFFGEVTHHRYKNLVPLYSVLGLITLVRA